MSLTKSAGVYGSVHERCLNLVIDEVHKQRPPWFNYGTDYFLARPDKAKLQPLAAEHITPEDPIPIPGTEGALAFDYILQIGRTAVDFHPGTLGGYPPEISLAKHQVVLTTELALTLAHPDEIRSRLVMGLDKRWHREYDAQHEIIATTLNVWVKAKPVLVEEPEDLNDAGSPRIDKLAFELQAIEIQDIKPDHLEKVIETICFDVLQWGFLQNLRLPASFLVLDMLEVKRNESVSPNPAAKNDRAEIWVDIELA